MPYLRGMVALRADELMHGFCTDSVVNAPVRNPKLLTITNIVIGLICGLGPD